MKNDDNALTEPESAVDTTGGAGEGELAQELQFFAWGDDGDNIWEDTELPLFANPYFGPASDVLNGKAYDLGTIPGSVTKYVGLYWCYGALTVNTENETLSCSGASATNLTQTDSLTGDVWFYVEQARNNPNFKCPAPRPPAPKVGAKVSAYMAPGDGVCTVTVPAGQSIQAALDAAQAGQTVCVGPGTHNSDTYPLRVSKDNLTLASTGGAGATTLSGGVILDNDGTKLTGFTLGYSTALSESFGVYINTGADGVQVAFNDMNGPGAAVTSRGVVNAIGATNALIANNDISSYLSGVFMNGSTNMVVELNTLTGNGVGSANDNPNGNIVRKNQITGNTLEGVGVFSSGGESISVNQNNIFGNGGPGNELNSYAVDAVNAENNWWGDLTPADEIGGAGVAQVDFTPFETSAFALN